MTCIYTDNIFFKISENNTFVINENTIKLITTLSSQVNAPEYNKTPQFNKSKKNKFNNENWKPLKKTEFIKKTGIEFNIDSIRKQLNKISKNNYDILKNLIFEEINNISSDPNLNLNLDQIGKLIFDIASSNELYSEVYANLFNELICKYNFMNDILINNYNKFNTLFDNIHYYDPNIDYDKFCENNKNIEKRKGISKFYVNLLKLNVLDINSFINIIINIQNNILEYIDTENKKEITDELSDIIFILISNTIDILIQNDNWNKMYDTILNISKIKIRTRPSISNKTIFKHMDLLDVIENFK